MEKKVISISERKNVAEDLGKEDEQRHIRGLEWCMVTAIKAEEREDSGPQLMTSSHLFNDKDPLPLYPWELGLVRFLEGVLVLDCD